MHERRNACIDALYAMRDARVWVIGDLMLDEYVTGDVTRVSPEAPVPVVLATGQFECLGGAANVAHGVAALGAHALLCGVVGADSAGDRVLSLCAEAGIDTRAVGRLGQRCTTRKLRVVSRNHQMLRVDWEQPGSIDPAAMQPLVQGLLAEPAPSAMVLSDYAKGALSPEIASTLIKAARRMGVPVIVDPKTRHLERYAGASVITPNLAEFEAASDCRMADASFASMAEVARATIERVGCEALVVTLGSRGMLAVHRSGDWQEIRATDREVFDVTGAGDTVAAALTLGLGLGLELPMAARVANAAAGLAVSKSGTAVVRASELAQELAPRSTDKVLDGEGLTEALKWWRLQDRKVVFTNGCFDLLHIGHLSLLRRAASEGDVLVVGLNTDRSIARLKGAGRPILPEQERARLIAALECVDAVVLFDHDTPLQLIERIRPDVLVKGADYGLDQVVGRQQVQGWGGRVVLAELVSERSTSALVRHIRKAGETG